MNDNVDSVVRLCKDCRHHKLHSGWRQLFGAVHECVRGYTDLVTGAHCFAECDVERSKGDCGKGARFYEPNARPQEPGESEVS